MKHPIVKNQIESFFHCKECMSEIPDGESPASWARINTGFTKKGLQVWCERHDKNIIHLDFLGNKVGYAG